VSQVIVNRGKAGSVLNGQNGSTTGADSNDALFLDWSGINYVYLPGVAGNSLSAPDEAALDVTGDIDIRVFLKVPDWTPASTVALLTKRTGGFSEISYNLFLSSISGGRLRFNFSTDGTTSLNVDATAALTGTDNTPLWVRVTRTAATGVVTFFSSTNGVSWLQVGLPVTDATGNIFSGSEPVRVGIYGSGAGLTPLEGEVYRAQIFNGIDGTKVLDIDTSVITTGAATSFTALTGQTVTINRSTDGRKTVAVVSPVWLFGTDDFMEVANNALLNFGATDSFTVVAVFRIPTFTINQAIVAKRGGILSTAGSAGFGIQTRTGPDIRTLLDDGVNLNFRDATVGTGLTTFAVTGDASTIVAYLNNSSSSVSRVVGNMSNALPFRIGRISGAGGNYADMELIAAAVYRRALTATEISRITAYYQARLS
jgi:hypothetical protein